MFSLNDILQQAQGGSGVQNLAEQFGISQEQAQSAIQALTPALSAGLQNRTNEASGLADLFGAMFNERHQQAFQDPSALNSAETAADGEDALARLFGNPQASQALAAHAAQTTGMNSSLLQSMIPVIMSMLMGGMFKGMQNSGLGGMLEQLGRAGANSPGNSSGGLGDLLGQVLGGSLGGGQGQQPAPQSQPQAGGGGLGDLLGQVLGGSLGGGQGQQRAPQPQTGGGGLGGGLGDLLGGLLGGGQNRAPQPQQADTGRADQIFPQGLDPSSLRNGMDVLGKMLNPGGQAQSGAQPGLQDILGQILGGGRR